MQQKWWLIAAGVIGIGLAVFLFPRPDTGADVPTAEARGGDPLDFKHREGGGRVLSRPGADLKLDPKARRDFRPAEQRLGPNPVAGELAKRRSTPEAVYAGRASGPWTIIRRQLVLMPEDEAAKAMAEEIEPIINNLRALRRDPAAGDYVALEATQKATLEKLRANTAWQADPVLVASLDRVDGILTEYHEAPKVPAAAPTTTAPAGEPAPAAAPTTAPATEE